MHFNTQAMSKWIYMLSLSIINYVILCINIGSSSWLASIVSFMFYLACVHCIVTTVTTIIKSFDSINTHMFDRFVIILIHKLMWDNMFDRIYNDIIKLN